MKKLAHSNSEFDMFTQFMNVRHFLSICPSVKARTLANGMTRNKYIFKKECQIDISPMFTFGDNLKNTIYLQLNFFVIVKLHSITLK